MAKKKKDKKEEVKTNMRYLSVLECTPGNRGTSNGEEISLITVADNDGDIETLAFGIPDTRRLIDELLHVLVHNGSNFARELLLEYFKNPDGSRAEPWDRTEL